MSNLVSAVSWTPSLQRFVLNAGKPDGEELHMRVFDWDEATKVTDWSPESAEEITNPTSLPNIRVIFAPADRPHPKTVHGLTELFSHFGVPENFINEGLRDVSLSLGHQVDKTNALFTWFHFACKDIHLAKTDDGLHITHFGENNSRGDVAFRKRKQANFNWIRSGFVLKVEPSDPKHITLLCFGAPSYILQRFRNMEDSRFAKMLEDPFGLLEVVMEELCWFVDERAWMVSDVFGNIEENTIEDARLQNLGRFGKEVDFPGLHSISKHIIFLQEAATHTTFILESIQSLHEKHMGETPSSVELAVQRAFEYRKSVTKSTQQRLASVDRRMANIMQLSFNLVTQIDSRTMQKESKSMKTVAVVTLVFLPLTTVATIFGSQFFTLTSDTSEDPYRLRVSHDFWLPWAIAVPLTVTVMVVWQLWYRESRAKLEQGKVPWWREWAANMRKPRRNNDEEQAFVGLNTN